MPVSLEQFATLTKLLAQGGREPARHTLYRLSWSSVPGCSNMSDPFTPRESEAVYHDHLQGRLIAEHRYN